jgi:hypothetical protein
VSKHLEHPSTRIFAPRCRTTGKLRFLSQDAALAYAPLYRDAGIEILRAYPCQFCGEFHLTSEPKRE